jgi:DNA-directed RNA polymerase specialized sigma24 family protein
VRRAPPETQAELECYAYNIACKTWLGYLRALGGDARNLDVDDLLGAAMLGAAVALARFDPQRGIKFSSFAITCVRGAIREGHGSRII